MTSARPAPSALAVQWWACVGGRLSVIGFTATRGRSQSTTGPGFATRPGPVYGSFRSAIPYDRIGFALYDEEKDVVRAVWARSEHPSPGLPVGYEAPISASSLKEVMEGGEPRVIDDLERYLAEHPESDATRRIVHEGMRSSLTCPLTALGRTVGLLFFSSTTASIYTQGHVSFMRQIVVVPDCSEENARRLAERLRSRIAGLALPHDASDVAPHVTISVGGATAMPSSGTTASALVRAAAEALYEAKRTGRNRASHHRLGATS